MCQIQVAVACFAVSRTKCNNQLPMLILARAAPASAFLVMWLVAKSDKFCHAHQIAVFTERDKQNPAPVIVSGFAVSCGISSAFLYDCR